MRILLTGGSGLLGRELLKIDSSIIAPKSHELNIINRINVILGTVRKLGKIDMLIHAAALTNQMEIDEVPSSARLVNIFGTYNMVSLATVLDIPIVFISTAYVFDGENAPYSTDSPVNPINVYAITKAAGEMIAKTYENHMIIRSCFLPNIFTYERAAIDQYTNRDYVDIIAPMIYNACINFRKGIVHIGTERKSMFELAKRRKPDVKPMSIKEFKYRAPRDISFKEVDGKFV